MVKYLSRKEAAKYLCDKFGNLVGCSVSTLNQMASKGTGPKFTKMENGRAAYTPDALDTYGQDRIEGAS